MTKLAGKVAVITGGSSGIGLATARKFVEEGAHVFITGRRQEELDKAAKSIGKNVTTVQGDVAKLDDLDRLYETVRTEKGPIDIVWAADLKDREIRVNTVSPGPIDTPIYEVLFKTKEAADAAREKIRQKVPMGRLGTSDEVAAAVLFLASDDSSYTTGADLPLDGGIVGFFDF